MRSKLLLIALLFAMSGSLHAQINIDSLFTSAINDSRQEKYDEAIAKSEQILTLYPDRYDVMVFVANVYAWKGETDIALTYIEKAYELNSANTELYDSWLNILLWSGKYEKIIEISKLAEQNNYPDKYNLVYKQATAYKNIGEYDKGIELIKDNQAYLDSLPLKRLNIELYKLNKSGAFSLYYSMDFIDENSQNPQQLAYVDYAFKIKRQTLIPRFGYANRFNTNDYQVEVDYYHILKDRFYLYASLGYSFENSLFPRYSAGLEPYFPIGKTSEASLGGRYLKYDKKEIFILTGNVNRYLGDFWLMLRPYCVIQDNKSTLTTMFSMRYYSADPVNYWGVEAFYGNSLDERYSVLQSYQQYMLDSYRVKIDKSIGIFKYHELKLSASYTYEEYIPDSFRNRLSFEVLFKIKI